MVEPSLDVKIVCQSSVVPGAQAIDGHPWRNWKIRLVALSNGKEQKGKLNQLLDHVEYILHPTFENPRRVMQTEPYLLSEKGWGEFDMRIVLYFVDNLVPPEVIIFDLNFRSSNFSVTHRRIFPDPPPRFVSLLYQPIVTTIVSGANTTSNAKQRPSPKLPQHQQQHPIQSQDPDAVVVSPASHTPQSTTHHPHHVTSPQSPLSQLDIPIDDRDDKPTNIGTTKRTRYGRQQHPPQHQTHQQAQQQHAPHHHHDTSTRSAAGKRHQNDPFTDDVYAETDLAAIHPIHHTKLEPETKRAWGIPQDLDIVELARRLSRMNVDQVDEFRAILRNASSEPTFDDMDEELVVDLYSLGADLLSTIWDFTERSKDQDTPMTETD